MKYCRQRPELSIDEPTYQLGGLMAELWSPEQGPISYRTPCIQIKLNALEKKLDGLLENLRVLKLIFV
jgi:hypothetical protein